MRDSWVHTSFVGSVFSGVARLRLENNLQWILNRQLSVDRRVQTVTLENKADYSWRRGRLVVQPMVKHLFKHVTNSFVQNCTALRTP